LENVGPPIISAPALDHNRQALPATGEVLNIRRHAILLFTYAAAILGGLALVVGFARFNALHEEFLGANFDSAHGARTLLKAGFFLELAAKDLETATGYGARRTALLAQAAQNLVLAESYGAEGHDKDPAVRAALSSRIQTLRAKLEEHRKALAATAAEPDYAQLLTEIRQLANDFGTAELDRWGTLSSANAALAERMTQLRLFILASIFIFLLIMAALGWSLARTRRTEADLLRAKAEIEAIQKSTLDASPLGIAYTDTTDMKNRRIKLANRQMSLIFGYSPEQLLDVEASRLHADRANYERLTRELPPRLSAGEVVREEALMQRRNGEPFWCALSVKAIDPGDLARGVVWTCEDISERKAAEVKLQQAMKKAEAASLAKSDFLANMSHELRTPFAGILGLLDLLQRTALSETQQRYTHLARDSSLQILSIVNNILDFSKIEAGKLSLDPVDFDLRRFFSTLAEAHATAAERKNLQFVLDCVEPLPVCLNGDSVRIRQIVDNLLSNAIKFTPQGEVRLRVEWIASGKRKGRLSVAVSDTGIGLPADLHERIFEKFTQADSSTTRMYGGTGLGLAICRQLAGLMNGSLKVESRSGEGCCFRLQIDLPVSSSSTCAALIAPGSDGAETGVAGSVVLLVDDNATNRNVFAELLTRSGCTVVLAEDGEQAVGLAGETSPDIILMDCQMPVIDGYEATRRIRAAEAPGQRVPILALTAHSTNSDRDNSLQSGMDDYLTKPLAPEALLRRIAYWLAQRRAPGVAETGGEKSPEPGGRGETRYAGRILLVDDNPAIREATRQLLEFAGCDVTTAENGKQALDIFDAARDGEDFDLVLMDFKMPVMGGIEASKAWRRREQERKSSPTAIIAVTGGDPAESRQSCTEAGMNDLLIKPYTPEMLFAVLAGWLAKK